MILRMISRVKTDVKIRLDPDWNWVSASGEDVRTRVLRTTKDRIMLSYAVLYNRIVK